jgi:predicted ABC-type ATPase
MQLPILGKLIEGIKFDFDVLAENTEETDRYWEHWWSERSLNVISRPEIISDEDSILQITAEKPCVDLLSNRELFDDFLKALDAGQIPARHNMTREEFGRHVTRIVACNVPNPMSGKPRLVFAGGGYGSGKTTVLNLLTQTGKLQLKMGCMVGVDYFKHLMPEYGLISAVADGRASFTVQKECTALGAALFNELVAAKKSFIWDSSMSNKPETLHRITKAREAGYELSMAAVLTPLEIAIRQAMGRARDSRRFPHKGALPASHVGFRSAFYEYLPLFDEVTVFANFGETDENSPYVIAEKTLGGKQLDVSDEVGLNALLND